MRRHLSLLMAVAAAALLLAAPGIAQAASPAVKCQGSYQRCDDLLRNEAEKNLYLGNSNGIAILFTSDGSQTQRWDIYQLSDGNYVIYNNGTNNVLTRGTGCQSNGGTYTYCVVINAEKSGPPTDQQWTEIQTAPFIFESDGSTNRCLDNPGADAPAGSQVVLYPCNTSDTAEQWFGTSSP
jgi:hypothetical protein